MIRTYGACTDDGTLLILVMEVHQPVPSDRIFFSRETAPSISHAIKPLSSPAWVHTLTPSPSQLAKDGTLRDLIRQRGGTLTDNERMRFVGQLAAGMSYLHSREVRASDHPVRPEYDRGCLAGREPSALGR